MRYSDKCTYLLKQAGLDPDPMLDFSVSSVRGVESVDFWLASNPIPQPTDAELAALDTDPAYIAWDMGKRRYQKVSEAFTIFDELARSRYDDNIKLRLTQFVADNIGATDPVIVAKLDKCAAVRDWCDSVFGAYAVAKNDIMLSDTPEDYVIDTAAVEAADPHVTIWEIVA